MHALTGDEWTCFAYDERGNCTEIEECDGTTYFEYNDTNLVTCIKYKDSVMNYFWYDAQQRRYAIQDSDRLSYFAWDQNGMDLLCERDTSGNVTAEYTHGYMPIDGIGSMVSAKKVENGTTYYQYPIYDHRGTVVRLVDQNGTTVGDYKYDAWGVPLSASETGASNRFHYQSNWIRLRDSAGRLCLSPTRLYHLEAGRFLEKDSSGYNADACAYVYAAGTPTVLVDANGRTVYDAEGSGLTQVPWGGYLHTGDKIINSKQGTIDIKSENLEGSSDPDWLAAKCVLARLGFVLPQTENGIYWGDVSSGYWRADTITWIGIGGNTVSFSIIGRAYYKGASEIPEKAEPAALLLFQDFARTVWHEVQGRNVDQVRGNAIKPYDDAVDKAFEDARNETADPMSNCCMKSPSGHGYYPDSGHAGAIRIAAITTKLEEIFCWCGVTYWGKKRK